MTGRWIESASVASITNTMKRSDYAFPCGGCMCNHCANSVETIDNCTGEAKNLASYAMSADGMAEIRRIRINGNRNDEYIITEEQSKKKQKKFKIVK
ncbi:MAG: hypothetical protein ACLRL6_00305 [Clostridium sp.]